MINNCTLEQPITVPHQICGKTSFFMFFEDFWSRKGVIILGSWYKGLIVCSPQNSKSTAAHSCVLYASKIPRLQKPQGRRSCLKFDAELWLAASMWGRWSFAVIGIWWWLSIPNLSTDIKASKSVRKVNHVLCEDSWFSSTIFLGHRVVTNL